MRRPKRSGDSTHYENNRTAISFWQLQVGRQASEKNTRLMGSFRLCYLQGRNGEERLSSIGRFFGLDNEPLTFNFLMKPNTDNTTI